LTNVLLFQFSPSEKQSGKAKAFRNKLFYEASVLFFNGDMKWKTGIMEYAVFIVVNVQVGTEE
jgi:hypothetical protein